MIVLGIDPGITNMGLGVVEQVGKQQRLLHADVITTRHSDPAPERIGKIYQTVLEAVRIYKPQAMAVEEQFFYRQNELAYKVGWAMGALLVVACSDPLAFGLLEPPGALGADIVAAEGQPLGNPLNFGGPYLGIIATRNKFVRRMPGRLVGATVDRYGRRGFVLTLQTREQHIRREKATSNICTNEALNALAAAVYLSLLGPQGVRQVAELCLRKAHYLKAQVAQLEGVGVLFAAPTFHEFVV
ncbi:MAG: hypothetical protein C4303_04725, partial [candidate division GAL15 bacterium]